MDKGTSATATADNRRAKTPARHVAGIRLTLRETTAGAWVVRDDGDRQGGCFVTMAAAMKYIRAEFGPDAEVVVLHREAA